MRQRPTYFRKMLNKVLSLELSSTLSDTYASGLDVVASVAEVVEVATDGAGEAWALFVDESRDDGVVMISNANSTPLPSPFPSQRKGKHSNDNSEWSSEPTDRAQESNLMTMFG